ncbi:MAG: hypothetical protein QM741_16220 [Rudaea sp.]|uniref:hypothetical protein n=1 Tax=Rudaea sp. TaxID=2136325 RepID=UPI0039E47172
MILRTRPFAFAIAAFLAAGATLALAADVIVQPAAGSGFVVTDASGTNERLRVQESGAVALPGVPGATTQSSALCMNGAGLLGPCGGGGSPAGYSAGTGLALSGSTFSVAPTYQLPQTCATNQVPQWSGTAWGCVALPGAGSAFTLPYAATISDGAAAFAITNDGGDALDGFTSQLHNSGVYGLNTGGGKGVFGVGNSGNGVEGASTSGSGVKGVAAGRSGQSGAAGVWGDSHDYYGVWGTSATYHGVHGDSDSQSGVFGGSNTGAGVWGESKNYDAIHGHTSNPTGTTSGVAGFGDGKNNGVAGISTSGSGVFGTSAGAGIWGESTGYDAIHGHTSNPTGNTSGVAGFGDGYNNGIAGISANGNGVFGTTQTGPGIYGHSDSGYGMATDGPVQQARSQNGWVKAMVHAKPVNLGGSGIISCFNSQLPADQASVPPCGFTYGEPTTGLVTIDFGFRVDDRFYAATPMTLDYSVAVGPQSTNVIGLSFSHYVLNCTTDYSKYPPKTTCSIDNIGRDDGEFDLIVF